MEKNELLRRMEDLCERAERSGTVCSSGYLSPAERYQTEKWAKRRGCTVVFSGRRSRLRADGGVLPAGIYERREL